MPGPCCDKCKAARMDATVATIANAATTVAETNAPASPVERAAASHAPASEEFFYTIARRRHTTPLFPKNMALIGFFLLDRRLSVQRVETRRKNARFVYFNYLYGRMRLEKKNSHDKIAKICRLFMETITKREIQFNKNTLD